MIDKILDCVYSHLWLERAVTIVMLATALSMDILTWWVFFTCHNVAIMTVIGVHRAILASHNLEDWDDVIDGWRYIRSIF